MKISSWLTRAMGRQSTVEPEIAVLFADVCDSTQLYERLGDERAFANIRACMQSLSIIVTNHGGRVVKTVGDEILAAFPTATKATDAAQSMHFDMQDATRPGGHSVPLKLRIGVHYGPAIEADGDIFGDTVNVAARLVGIAKENQIIVSEPTLRKLAPNMQNRSRPISLPNLKGKREDVAVYELLWLDAEEVTQMGSSDDLLIITRSKLKLNYRDRVWSLDGATPITTLGRDAVCSVVVQDKTASRVHARIERRGDKFFLIDQSLNGTHVLLADGNAVILRREEMMLSGRGKFCLGHVVGEITDEDLAFDCTADEI
jgi:adenylate cyclase